MYRILLVDDERIERKGMRFLLNQLGADFEIEEAQNGKIALDYIENHELDILLTDVKMPFMDGIELIKHVAKERPSLKIVIFSGHNEFEYAKEAMRAGVSDYILKPVDPKEFEDTMKRVIRELEKEQEEREKKEKEQNLFKKHLLYALVNGASIEELKKEAQGIVDIQFFNAYKQMMLIEFESNFYGREDERFAQKIREEYKISAQYLNLNPQQSLLFFDMKKNRREEAEHLVNAVKQDYNELCYVAISSEISGSDGILKAMEELEVLMENRFYQSESHVYTSDMEERSPIAGQIDDDTLMKQMKQDINMKDIANLRKHFERLCEKYRSKTDFSQVYIKFIFSSLLKDFYENLPEMEEKELNEEIDELYRSNDFLCVMNIIDRNIGHLEEAFSNAPQIRHKEVEAVKQYIYSHYGEELGIEQLAAKVYLAPSYLSCIFKKETGQNLSKFIKAYRMEKAKEMLEQTHQKIGVISLSVGYPNVSYFCQSFREYFGISPQKFRNYGRGGGMRRI